VIDCDPAHSPATSARFTIHNRRIRMLELSLPRSRGGYGWIIAGYLAAYVALDWVSYIYPVAPPLAITPWNPPPGLSLALLLRYGTRNGPWLFVAALAAEILVRGTEMPIVVLLLSCALPAAVYTSAVVLLRGPLKFNPEFTTLRDATVFCGTVALATALLAFAFVSLFYADGLLPEGVFAKSVAQYWIGDLIGIVVTTPLVLVFTRGPLLRFRVPDAETVAQAGAVLLSLWIVFGSGWVDELKLFYLLFLPVIWIAMRHGVEGTTLATMTIQIGLIVAMRLGGYNAAAVLEFQFLLLAVAVTGLFLGVTVSERLAISQQLREKQIQLDRSLRLAAASEMASALAHELNQPLSAIGTYVRACQLMVADVKPPAARLQETMDKVVQESARAGNVVRQLRDFFRTGSGQLSRIDVLPLLQSVIEGARLRTERHRVRWRLAAAANIPAVLINRIQVETVLYNLIANSIDALKTGRADTEREISVAAVVESEHYVLISVADNGPGVPAEIVAQLFRPFATNKPQGMGLGLAISKSIIEGHGGRLWLESAEPGSIFRFTLPIAREGK
jgi:two-component system sensor kinase FixL